jgi:hypothetical protein
MEIVAAFAADCVQRCVKSSSYRETLFGETLFFETDGRACGYLYIMIAKVARELHRVAEQLQRVLPGRKTYAGGGGAGLRY